MIGFPLFPEAASTIAGSVDLLYFFLMAVSAFFSLLIVVLIFYFAVKYRRKPERSAEQVHERMELEIAWTVVPFLITLTPRA